MDETPSTPQSFTIEIALNKYNLTELILESLVIEFCGKILETGVEDGIFTVEFDDKDNMDTFKKVIDKTYKK